MGWEQNKAKGRKHAVDMSAAAEELQVANRWKRPPAEECEENTYPSELPGGNPAQHRLMIRMVREILTYALVEFALVFQTKQGTHWRIVASIDSCHDVEVHLHQYVRSTQARVGDAESLCQVQSMSDLDLGYDTALERLEGTWQTLRERWHYG